MFLFPCSNIFIMWAYNWVVISKFNLRTSALIDRKTSRPINMLVRTRRRAKYVFISVIVSAPRPSLAAATGQKNPDCGDTKRDNTGKNEMVAMITPSPHSSYSYYFASNINSFFQTYLCVCFSCNLLADMCVIVCGVIRLMASNVFVLVFLFAYVFVCVLILQIRSWYVCYWLLVGSLD